MNCDVGTTNVLFNIHYIPLLFDTLMPIYEYGAGKQTTLNRRLKQPYITHCGVIDSTTPFKTTTESKYLLLVFELYT